MESGKESFSEWGSSGPPVDDRDEFSARAFYSSDFDWEELREEIEKSRGPDLGSTGFDAILEAERRHEADSDSPVFSASAWQAFHKNHSKELFFKERRYLVKEFPELVSGCQPITVLEVGCGTGSSVAPILRAAALDRAKLLVIDQAGLHESQSKNFQPFLCDISVEPFPSWLCCIPCRSSSSNQVSSAPTGSASQFSAVPSEELFVYVSNTQITGSRDEKLAKSETTIPGELIRQSGNCPCCVGGVTVVMLIFTLSAIPLEKMRHVLQQCAAVLQPGGYLLFRDYGLYDMTMLRFPSSQKVAERLYHRMDGTLSYFFSLEVVRELFTGVGLVEEELHYCCVELLNRRKQLPMKRVWVHAKFRKPVLAVSPIVS